jgi:hypothetical protein
VLLGVTGVVTREQRQMIRLVVRRAISRDRVDAETEQRLRTLGERDLTQLHLAIGGRWDLDTIAATESFSDTAELKLRLVRSLRQVAGMDGASDHDDRIGEYLFSDVPVAERDAISRSLVADDVDPGELHTLEQTMESLRKLPRRAWEELEAEREGVRAK